jgi:hypothetical protein
MTPGLDGDLEVPLRRAEGLAGAAAGLAFSLADLAAIDLPPAATADRAQVQAIAALYFAAEMETARIIPATESLAGLARTGSLNVDLGTAAPLLQAFWQERRSRASEEERRGFFSGLFGAPLGPDDAERPANIEFEDLMIDLCEALYKLDEQASNPSWGGVAQQARVRSAARRLVANLTRVSGGMTVFLAREILVTLRQAIAILAHPAIRAALGARTLWDAVDAIDRRLRRPPRDNALYLRRARAGLTVLAWLADAAPALEGSSKPLVGLDHPVIEAAVDWLESSLSLGEEKASSETVHPAEFRLASLPG